MSISGISGQNYSNNLVMPGTFSTRGTEFQQLGQDLATGNLSAAQSDLATLEQAFTQPASASTTTNSNPVAQAFQQLSTDLQSGNLAAAQKDYLTIQQDFKNGFGHFHHGRMPIEGGPVQNNLMQELSQLGQELSSTTLQSSSASTAQQAYTTLA